MNHTFQAEDMRKQLAMLKDKLDKQNFINERLIKESTRSKVSSVMNTNLMTSLIGLILSPLVVHILIYELKISWGPVATFLLMLAGETIYNSWNSLQMRRNYFSGTLLDASQYILNYKRRQTIQMFIEVPLITLWFSWVAWEIHNSSSIPMLIAAAIGLLYGYGLYLWQQCKLKQAAKDIEDLMKTETNEEEVTGQQ